MKRFSAEYKAVSFQLKAFDPQAGTLEGYASTWDEDAYGDVITKGAFIKTIRERVAAGKVPLLDSHRWDAAHTIGTVTEAFEDDKGLYIKAVLASTPDAQAIRTKVVEGHLNRFSIGYEAIKERWQQDDEKIIRYLDEIRLLEVSVVPLPANEEAAITGVKGPDPQHDPLDALIYQYRATSPQHDPSKVSEAVDLLLTSLPEAEQAPILTKFAPSAGPVTPPTDKEPPDKTAEPSRSRSLADEIEALSLDITLAKESD